VPVYGTRKIVLKSYCGELGFDPAFSSILVESAQLRSPPQRLV
jgi:hypothetical protein